LPGIALRTEASLRTVAATNAAPQEGVDLLPFGVEYHSVSSLADGTPIEFEVNSTGEDYIDFTNS
jgi:hypothetical protein